MRTALFWFIPLFAFLHQPPLIAAPVVLELFTSEGCSSCPPADKVLSEIAEKSPIDGVEIIPLGWHVDYWNNLGWPDRFSNVEYTRRQHIYAQVGNRTSVFTPEAVLNGLGGFNGSDRGGILRVAQVLSEKSNAEVEVGSTFPSPDKLKIEIEVKGDIPVRDEDPIEILVLIAENNLATEVKRGENSGRTLRHDAVVRSVKNMGSIRTASDLPYNKEYTLDWNPEWKRENCKAVVLLQEKHSRLILGAEEVSVQGED